MAALPCLVSKILTPAKKTRKVSGLIASWSTANDTNADSALSSPILLIDWAILIVLPASRHIMIELNTVRVIASGVDTAT